MTVSRWILLRLRYASDKSCREKQNTHFVFRIFLNFFFLWDTVEKYCTAEQATDDNVIWRTLIACWITKATNIPWEYVLLIAFPQQQCLHERASILRYTHIACLVYVKRRCQISLPYCVFYICVSVHHKSIIYEYNKPTRCSSGSIVFINNYKYALHVSDALCDLHQEHYKL